MSRPWRQSLSAPQLLVWGQEQLSRAGKGPHEARELLEWALRVDSLLRAPSQVGQRAAERYRSAIAQRQRGFPLQHITGEMYFRTLRLQAGPGVFAVRPETEMLVEEALTVLEGSVVADLCAGSGAVGLSLAVEVPGADVTGVELSSVAAAYARRNYDRYRDALAPGASYRLVEGDAITALAGREGQFDLVVTNPPYVPGQPALRGEALYDPEVALYGGGEDGLVLPRGIVLRAGQLLRPGGWLLMEHAESQDQALVGFALDNHFSAAQTLPDLTGRPRFLRAQK